MKYETGYGFRMALETRLKAESARQKLPLIRLRKAVAFDRLLARLSADPNSDWILKGGFALQVRLQDRARTTKDIDLLVRLPREEVHRRLVLTAAHDMGDFSRFVIGAPTALPVAEGPGAVRCHVDMLIDDRQFEMFNLDVGLNDRLITPPESLLLPSLLSFADLPAVTMPCYPIAQHLAEKVHAYVREYATCENTRVKDLADILLIAEFCPKLNASELRKALEATFRNRDTPLPSALMNPPRAWTIPYAAMAKGVGLKYGKLSEAITAARIFLNPVLQGSALGEWHAETGEWRN